LNKQQTKYLNKKNKKMYKKIITIIAFAIVPMITFAQTSVFDKFEDMDDVSTVVVNSEAFRMLSKMGGSSAETKEYTDMISGLTELKVFTTESNSIATKMQTTVKHYLKKNSMVELMRAKDKRGNVKIYVRKGKSEDFVKELLMYINGMDKASGKPEAIILSLTGNIDLNKINQLTDKYTK